ncbi:hypothetical protein D3C76_434680 [compost metagenome]
MFKIFTNYDELLKEGLFVLGSEAKNNIDLALSKYGKLYYSASMLSVYTENREFISELWFS